MWWYDILKKSDHTSNNKVKLFCESLVFIEEEWFDDTHLTNGATFLTALIKRAKYRFNHEITLPCETKLCILEMASNNGKKKVSIYCVRNKMDDFVLNEICSVD